MKVLIDECGRHQPNEQHVQQLLKLTFNLRRKEINDSLQSTTALKEAHPYFGYNKWVSIMLFHHHSSQNTKMHFKF